MNMRRIVWRAGLALVVLAGLAVLLWPDSKPQAAGPSGEAPASPRGQNPVRETVRRPDVAGRASGTASGDAGSTVAAPTDDDSADRRQMTAEEKREAEEAQLVDAFDAAVDKWMEPQGKAVTMAEVDVFRDMFRKVPKSRKEECLQRALNLVPDENVMLLAGILLDKGQDKELLDLVYNDILNRDESVKKPILNEIFKDREHPNWADTAWILDVTGELPNVKKQ